MYSYPAAEKWAKFLIVVRSISIEIYLVWNVFNVSVEGFSYSMSDVIQVPSKQMACKNESFLQQKANYYMVYILFPGRILYYAIEWSIERVVCLKSSANTWSGSLSDITCTLHEGKKNRLWLMSLFIQVTMLSKHLSKIVKSKVGTLSLNMKWYWVVRPNI